MTRLLVGLTLLLVTILGVRHTTGVEVPAPPLARPKAKTPVVIISTLDKTNAYPGDVIRLTEVVPVERHIKVSSFSHKVYTIGQYDFTTNSLVNREPEKALYLSAIEELSGNVGGAGDGHLLFHVANPRQEGLEHEFKAKQLGIYLIKAEWKLWRSGEVIESNPVVLTVSPPLDKVGKPIIKKEWIDPITWEHRPQ